MLAAEDRGLSTGERKFVEGGHRVERVADELLDRDEHRCNEVVVSLHAGSPAQMLNQDAAPVNEEHLVNREAPLSKNGRGEDGRQDGEERERENGRDGRDVGSERGRDANGQSLLSEPGTDGAV